MFARPGRPFTTLFVCLLAAVVVRPVLAYNPIGRLVFAAAMIVFFVATIRVLCRNWRQRSLALGSGIVWLGARAPAFLWGAQIASVEVIGRVAELVFLTLTVTLLVTSIVRNQTVTLDNILGAFTGYLLIAVIWGIGYSLVEMAHPGAFRLHEALKSEWTSAADRDWLLNYFSCCTLMTVGYGDITPVHPAARTLAVLEAMMGQLYLAVLVAVLVGIKVARGFAPEVDPE